MKSIAIFTMGTRGDVQPYIVLSRALSRKGYDVTLGSHPCWKDLIESSNVKFAPIGKDIDIEKEAATIRGKYSNPVISMLKTMNFVFRIIQDSTQEIYEICKNKDLIIVSHSQMGATEAEALNIPTVNVTLQKEMIPLKNKPQSFFGTIFGSMIAKQIVKPYNKIRKVYGLNELKASTSIMSGKINLIPISKYVLERNKYWDENNILTGYWFEEDKEYIPSKELEDFLRNGEKPVILSLGAMSFEDKPEVEKLDMFVNAFRKAGVRAIIQGFQKSIKDYKLPPSIMSLGSCPHSYLFRHGFCVIHHCGFGTSASTLINGIPSIPVPHVLDQMGFAKQLHDLGVATKPIITKKLSEETIYEAILDMKEHYQERCNKVNELSKLINSEGGVNFAADLIDKIMN